MKRIISLLIIALTALSISVFAHPGRLDANGGHWDRSSGEYHFHDGNSSGGGSSYNPDYEDPNANFVPPYEPPERTYDFEDEYEEEYEYEDEKGEDTIFDTIADIAAFVLIGFVCLIYFASLLIPIALGIWESIYGKLLKKHLPKHNLNEYEKALNDIYSVKQEIVELKALIKAPLVQIPEKFEIGSDNLPKEKGAASWGKTFTLYVSYNGKKLHSKYRCSNAVLRKHVYNLGKIRNENLCKICTWDYTIPDLSWYHIYLKQHLSNKTFKIKHQHLQSLFEELTKYYEKCNKGYLKFLIQLSKKNIQKLNELNAERKKHLKKHTNNNT